MRATVDRAGLDSQGRLAASQDPARPEGRPLQGARRHRAGLRRLLRAAAGHAPAPGLRRRPVRAPPLAHGAVGLLRRRGGRRQDRRRRGGGELGHARPLRPGGGADALPEPDDRPAAPPRRPGVLRREQGDAAGRRDLPVQPQAPRPLPEVRLQAEGAARRDQPRARPAGHPRRRRRARRAGRWRCGATRRSRRRRRRPRSQRFHRITNARLPRARPHQGDRDRRRPGARRHAAAREGRRADRLRDLPHAGRQRGARRRGLREVPRDRPRAAQARAPRAAPGSPSRIWPRAGLLSASSRRSTPTTGRPTRRCWSAATTWTSRWCG